jgi:hypothetical protein
MAQRATAPLLSELATKTETLEEFFARGGTIQRITGHPSAEGRITFKGKQRLDFTAAPASHPRRGTVN